MPARGEVWFANLGPTRGAEQAGTRAVILFQADAVNEFTSTVLCIPLTPNLRRAALSTCPLIRRPEGGLSDDSVALCHQMRALDKTRLVRRPGRLSPEALSALEGRVLFTTGML